MNPDSFNMNPQDKLMNRDRIIKELKVDELNLNTLERMRKGRESELRVHIYIRGVYIPYEEATRQFLAYIHERVRKVFVPAFVQVADWLKNEEYNIALGFRYDEEAIEYVINHKKKILIQNRKGNLEEHEYTISEPFRILLEHKGLLKRKPRRSRSRSRSRESARPKDQLQRESKKADRENKVTVALIGLPTNFLKSQLLGSIRKRKQVQISPIAWLTEKDLHYAEVQLCGQDIEVAHFEQLSVGGVPILALAADSGKVLQQLSCYQVQVELGGKQDQVVAQLEEFGRVVDLARSGERGLVATMHSVEQARRVEHRLRGERLREGVAVVRTSAEQHVSRLRAESN